MAKIPAMDATRRNHLLLGMSRRNSQQAQYHKANRNRSVPNPTMMSHARWTTFTSRVVGRSDWGTASKPWTTVFFPVEGSDSQDASPGIGIPPLTVPLELR